MLYISQHFSLPQFFIFISDKIYIYIYRRSQTRKARIFGTRVERILRLCARVARSMNNARRRKWEGRRRIRFGEATNKWTRICLGVGVKMGGSSLRRIGEFVPIGGDFIKETAVTEDIVEQVLCAGWVARVVHTPGPSRSHWLIRYATSIALKNPPFIRQTPIESVMERELDARVLPFTVTERIFSYFSRISPFFWLFLSSKNSKLNSNLVAMELSITWFWNASFITFCGTFRNFSFFFSRIKRECIAKLSIIWILNLTNVIAFS